VPEPEPVADQRLTEPEPVAAGPEPVAEESEPEPEAVPVAKGPEPTEAEVEQEPVPLPAGDEALVAGAVVAASPRRWRLWNRRPDETPAAVEDEPSDPWLVAELPAAPDEPAADSEPDTDEDVRPATAAVVAIVAVAQPMSRHSLDPLAEPAGRRWGRRRSNGDEIAVTEVPTRPTGVRVLPGRSEREG
jgi:hypothetical protein